MSTARSTFSKRNREAALKDKAKLKEERRAAKRGEVRTSKGPEIAWDEAVHAVDSDADLDPPAHAPSAVDAPPPAPAAPAEVRDERPTRRRAP